MGNLLDIHVIILDRPKGTPHPRHRAHTYRPDYGYLEDTTAGGGDGIDDVRSGALDTKTLTGILCMFDRLK